jgi:hypothetical protein
VYLHRRLLVVDGARMAANQDRPQLVSTPVMTLYQPLGLETDKGSAATRDSTKMLFNTSLTCLGIGSFDESIAVVRFANALGILDALRKLIIAPTYP